MAMRTNFQEVKWKMIFYDNFAHPKALFVTWLVCHKKLDTKERLHKLGMMDNMQCCFRHQVGTIQHLFSECVI